MNKYLVITVNEKIVISRYVQREHIFYLRKLIAVCWCILNIAAIFVFIFQRAINQRLNKSLRSVFVLGKTTFPRTTKARADIGNPSTPCHVKKASSSFLGIRVSLKIPTFWV